MSSQLSASTVVAATVGTAATLFLGYALYFDHRRRTDPEFRKTLRREAKRQARAAKQEAEAGKAEERRRIRLVVEEAPTLPTNAEEVETFFMQEVSRGEALCQDDPIAAAGCFYRAMKVYPQPKELMSIYDRTVPKPILDILAEIIAADPALIAKTGGSASGSDSGSIVNVE